MADAVVGKAVYQADLDRSELDRDLQAANADIAKSGAAAEEAFSGKASTSASKWGASVKAAGAVGAVAFGALSVAAMGAERAQGDFMAATGRSREEAVQFTHDMNGLVGQAGTVGKSFGEIARTGTLVAQQMGTTGDETALMTEKLYKLSKVSGIDVTKAVTGMDDAMDAWGLSGKDAAAVLDVLVAGTQKYGGTIESSLSLLNSLAPALQAAGMSWNDATGVINLFNRAGVDAQVTATAFAKALGQVESPEELNQLVADIAATKDPFERAQRAAEIFGAKAGPKLALALSDSGGDLTKFRIDVDDAAGTLDKAADDATTFADRVRGEFEKALAGARELGMNMGPALTGAASLVSLAGPLAGKFGGLLTTIGKAILPTAVLVGTTTGAAQGEAQVAAATGPQIVRNMAARIAAMAIPLAPAGTTVGTAVGAAAGAALVIGLAAAAPEIHKTIQTIGFDAKNDFFGQFGDQDKGLLYGTVVDSALDAIGAANKAFHDAPWPIGYGPPDAPTYTPQQVLDAAAAAGEGLGANMASHTWKAFSGHSGEEFSHLIPTFNRYGQLGAEATGQGYVSAADHLADDMRETLRLAGQAAKADALGSARQLGAGIPGEIGRGMLDEAGKARTAADTLRDILQNGLTPDEEANKLIGKKHIQLISRGMHSEIPGAKETAQQVAIATINTLEDTARTGAKGQKDAHAIGILYDQLLASGLTAGEARAALAAGGVADATIDGLEEDVDKADNAATAYVSAFTKALRSGRSDVWAAMNYTFGGAMRGQSPPKEGPLRDAILSAPRVAQSYVDAFNGTLERAQLRGLGGLVPALTATATVDVRHTVSLDLRNAPAGITNEGVAALVQPVLDFDAHWQAKMDEAQAASGLRWVQAR